MSGSKPAEHRRKLTKQDVAFTLECLNDGIKLNCIAHYVFGISEGALIKRLHSWGVEW
jgi:hypothetical protein